jgi:cell division protein FtsQ
VVITGAWLLGKSSFFALNEVEVYGNKYLSEKRLADMMGIQPGENLIELPSREVAGMLMDSKWVRSVSLRKEYPGRLVVRIDEAVPQALLQVRDDVYFVDDEGNVLEKLKTKPVQFLPVIVSDSARNPSTFKEAVALAGVIKQRGLAAEKDRIEITGVEEGPESLTMKIDGLTAKVGQGDYDEKLRRLFELSDEIRRRHINIKYVDLRFANSVIVKPFKEAME